MKSKDLRTHFQRTVGRPNTNSRVKITGTMLLWGWQSITAVVGVDGLIAGAALSTQKLIGFLLLLAAAILTFTLFIMSRKWTEPHEVRVRRLRAYDFRQRYGRYYPPEKGLVLTFPTGFGAAVSSFRSGRRSRRRSRSRNTSMRNES